MAMQFVKLYLLPRR